MVRSIIPLEPALVTLHSSGGPEMMRAAANDTATLPLHRCTKRLALSPPLALPHALASQVAAAAEAADKAGCKHPRLLAVTVLTLAWMTAGLERSVPTGRL